MSKESESLISRILCPRLPGSAVIHLGPTLPPASSDLPESGRDVCRREQDGRPAVRFPIWSCSAWGLPCLTPSPVERCALTAPFHPYRPTRRSTGGMLSVALSVASPRLAVSEHATRWSSDFPPPAEPAGSDRLRLSDCLYFTPNRLQPPNSRRRAPNRPPLRLRNECRNESRPSCAPTCAGRSASARA
jgi:hypothetical protein